MAKATSDLVAAFKTTETAGETHRPSWNIAPTQGVPVVTERITADGELARELETAKWGLVPAWAKDPKIGSRMINARSETVLDKPSFRSAATKHRALIPAEGYYEWMKTIDGKVPTYLKSETNELLAFAGLYEFWPDPALPDDHEDKWVMSCTILTRPATDTLGHIHDRTPVIIPTDLHANWLDLQINTKPEVQELLHAIPDPVLTPLQISDKVNSVRNNGPDLIDPVAEPDELVLAPSKVSR